MKALKPFSLRSNGAEVEREVRHLLQGNGAFIA
jgi:hypothetical protein